MQVNLRQVRERLFVTQQELAERTGLTEATISRIENGLNQPRISTVRRLAVALGVQPEDLVQWGDNSQEMGKAAA